MSTAWMTKVSGVLLFAGILVGCHHNGQGGCGEPGCCSGGAPMAHPSGLHPHSVAPMPAEDLEAPPEQPPMPTPRAAFNGR